MSLERLHSEKLCRCENCGRRSLSSAIIDGHHFCSNVCYSEFVWKREKRKSL